MDEKYEMGLHLARTPCPDCKGIVELTGEVYYTDPLLWACACTQCHKRGTVSYTSIDIIDLPEDKLAEVEQIRDQREYWAFVKQHGRRRPKNIKISWK